MNTRNHFCTNVMLGAFLFSFSQLAWPLGLGEAQLNSFLGQPLDVKIALITRPTDDLSSVSASLASAADYELIGASRDNVSVPLQISIRDPDGDAYIAVSSRLAVDNPVLRLILELNWSSGRMLREYTLFLDPPAFSQPAPAPRIDAPGTTPARRIQAARTTATQSTPADPGDAAIMTTGEYGPVQSGDTLSRIAKDWSAGSGLNLNKVMLAIQRQNPQAFSRNNINLLRRGAILRMPLTDDVDSISSTLANSEVTKQFEAFLSRRNRDMASTVVPLLVEESAAIEPVADELMGAEPAPEDAARPAELRPSQLELLPPSDDNVPDGADSFTEAQAVADDALSAQALREELARKEEELFNQQQQNTYLEERLKELESQLAESREGTVEDKNLAGMEERLRQERMGETETAAPKVVSSPKQEKPWYSRFPLWLLALMVIVAVVAGWWVSRRGRSGTEVSGPGAAADSLREIKDEAEDVLRVLDKAVAEKVTSQAVASEEVAPGEADPEEAVVEVTAAEPETPATSEPDDTQAMPAGKKRSVQDDDAHVLDQESADPEIQLDLARAYISMGDKEAARVILDEVIANGSEEQQAAANKMKQLL